MIAVLKRGSAAAVRVAHPAAARVEPVPVVDPLVAELAALRRIVAGREQELVAARIDAEATCADAYVQGKTAGLAQGESREAERIAAMRDSLAEARALLDRHLAHERDIAVDIAQAMLTTMIGDAIPYRDLVAATAAHHAAALAQSAIVRLAVSAGDFPDDAARAALRRLDERIEIVVDPSLDAGACRFDLTLGALDAAIPAQAAAAAALLDTARRDHGAGS